MALDVKIPEVGESITEALISRWLKSEGDHVEKDEPIVELETDKVAVELPAPESGVLIEILAKDGDTAAVGEVIARLEPGEAREAPKEEPESEASEEEPEEEAAKEEPDEEPDEESDEETAEPTAEKEKAKDRAKDKAKDKEKDKAKDKAKETPAAARPPVVMPAAQRLLEKHGLDADEVEASGPGGRLLKEDVERHLSEIAERPEAKQAEEAPAEPVRGRPESEEPSPGRREETVPMSPIRRRIAERLVSAQQNAALLTTFNEVDMSAVVELRQRYREEFQKRWEVKLGFMSFFVRAAVDALRQFPQVNAEIRGTDIVYRNYSDIGIAVSTDRGLLVPILRNAERLGFADVERAIGDFGERARDGKIKLEELEGGTFTISNGGVFGSLLSTPIVNPPQSGVLGLHAIEDRPIARDGEVVIRPMMYVALSYDHRIIDGREAVTFLRRIKQTVEDPSRLLLEV
ncbi:MAG TPA: 2-oxoglutarate dehydrogenase complex dihydrolipoyllysine-residue succinyltransferase [Thermoanaerobaculia bacterium]|nr:2-oxoglutarate dehydrogenase complex dihydrolipoyllysine-residue succinyltransferase [Thermoanaerobaculia bacterium]